MSNSDSTIINRIDDLVQQLERLPDASARTLATELVNAVMALHAASLERILAIIAASAPDTLRALAADDQVSPVLVLHGLHPDTFEMRLLRAVEKLQVFFDSRGAGIELLDAEPHLVRVRFTGRRAGAGAAARQLIESAIYEAVPEVEALVIEGATEEHEAGQFVPLASLLATQQA